MAPWKRLFYPWNKAQGTALLTGEYRRTLSQVDSADDMTVLDMTVPDMTVTDMTVLARSPEYVPN